MNFDIQYSYDDFRAAQLLHMAPRRRFNILLYPLLACFAFVGFIAFLAILSGEGTRVEYGLFLFVAYLALMFGVMYPRRWKRIYDSHKLLHKMYQYEFTPDAFSVSSEYGASRIPWKEFPKWREGRTLFLVYQSDIMFHAIPKRVFADRGEQERFRSYLLDGIGQPMA